MINVIKAIPVINMSRSDKYVLIELTNCHVLSNHFICLLTEFLDVCERVVSYCFHFGKREFLK